MMKVFVEQAATSGLFTKNPYLHLFKQRIINRPGVAGADLQSPLSIN